MAKVSPKNKRRITSWMRKGIFDGLVLAGVKESVIIRYIESDRLDDLNTDLVVNFLRHKLKPHTDALHTIYQEHEPERWKAFEAHKLNNLPEVIALRQQKKNVFNMWKSRPKIWSL